MADMAESAPRLFNRVLIEGEEPDIPADQQELYPRPNSTREVGRVGSDSEEVDRVGSDSEEVDSGEELIQNAGGVRAAWRPRRALLITAALVGTVGVAWWSGHGGTAAALGQPAAPTMGPARSLLQSPDLQDLIVVQLRAADSHAQAMPQQHLHQGVRTLMDDLGSFLDDNLDETESLALLRAQHRIDKGTWQDMARLFEVSRDPQIRRLGQRAFLVASNISATPDDIEQALRGNLGLSDAEVQRLGSAMLPHRFRSAARTLGRMHKNIDLGFSQASVQLHRPDAGLQLPGVGEFRLVNNAGGAPHDSTKALRGRRLLTAEGIIGVTALGLTGLLEVFVQLQLIFPDFDMPFWMWAIFFVPAVGTGSTQCGVFGLDPWCDVFIGLMGLNALESLMHVMR